jgi:hypothetical protein
LFGRKKSVWLWAAGFVFHQHTPDDSGEAKHDDGAMAPATAVAMPSELMPGIL